jgi:hypothetical protein
MFHLLYTIYEVVFLFVALFLIVAPWNGASEIPWNSDARNRLAGMRVRGTSRRQVGTPCAHVALISWFRAVYRIIPPLTRRGLCAGALHYEAGRRRKQVLCLILVVRRHMRSVISPSAAGEVFAWVSVTFVQGLCYGDFAAMH